MHHKAVKLLKSKNVIRLINRLAFLGVLLQKALTVQYQGFYLYMQLTLYIQLIMRFHQQAENKAAGGTQHHGWSRRGVIKSREG